MNKLILLLLTLVSISVFANENNTDERESRFESLSKLTKVIGTVEKYYVDDLKLDEIIDKTLKGLMEELDAHSAYMDKKYFKEMNIQTKGEFGGLGITVGMRDGALTVISPIDDTPAYKAGVKAGDIILKIDDASTINMSLDEAVGLMRGKANTPIELTLVRKGESKPLTIKIIRDIIKIQSVYAKKIEDEKNKLLYLRVTSFDQNVVDGLKKAIKENKDTQGYILDLRNNPGGLLNQAIGVVDIFVDEGVVVSQKGRDEKDEEKFRAKTSNTLTKLPLVVLVNGGSASASEIVSGSLQDHKRAIVVGTKTFGKGSVQVILPIDDKNEEGIKLTIARYYLPSGRTIQAVGVTPDILAYEGEAVDEPENNFKIKESELKKHLLGELEKIDDTNTTKEETPVIENNDKEITKDVIFKDNQLKTGIDILKSLIIFKN